MREITIPYYHKEDLKKNPWSPLIQKRGIWYTTIKIMYAEDRFMNVMFFFYTRF